MWPRSISVILLIVLSILHLITAIEFENCCRYGFEDGMNLNMLKGKNWTVIRSQNFNYCENQVEFGRESFRRCKSLGEEMALNCQIGKYLSLLNHRCDPARMNPTTYGCCMTCANGKRFAEDEYDLFKNKSMEFGEELFTDEHRYDALMNQVGKDIEEQCKLMNLVNIVPKLQLSTFHQCCSSWTYNFNQNFYPEHYNLGDTCDRINVCLDKQNHTKFSVDKSANREDLIKLKTDNLMKIIKAHMRLQNDVFEEHFDQVLLQPNDESESANLRKADDLRSLRAVYDSSQTEFHKTNLRSLADEKQFHPNISSYELVTRQVPFEKFKYHHCNKMCKDNRPLDYSESYTTAASRKAFTQCFHDYSEQFCAKPIECSAGFFPNHNNTLCIKLDECVEKLDDCLPESEYCVKHYDGYACECRDGYRYNLLSKKCVNIDECAENGRLCPEQSYCRDLAGSYECVCFEGLFMNEFRQCTPYLPKPAGGAPAKPNSNDPLYFSTNQSKDESPEDTNEEQKLAEKLKYEREHLEQLKKGMFPMADDPMKDEIADKNPVNRQLKSDEQSTGDQLTKTDASVRGNEIENSSLDNRSIGSSTDRPTDSGVGLSVQGKPTIDAQSSKIEAESEPTEPAKVPQEPTASPISENLAPNKADKELRELPSNNAAFHRPTITPIIEAVEYQPCPNGTFLSGPPSGGAIKCVDIDECSDPKLNNCTSNQTCVNLHGTYNCTPAREECPPNYKAINLMVQHHLEPSSSRASTSFCKYVPSRKFETDEALRHYEKSNSIVQFIIFDTISLPFSKYSDYIQVPRERTLTKADGDRTKPKGFIIYLVDKSTASQKMKTDFVGDLKIRSTDCSDENIGGHFQLIELSSNVFAILLLDAVKQPCTIQFDLDVQSKYTTQTSEFNRELYRIQLIVYQYNLEFPIAGDLKSKCLKNNLKIC